MWLKHEAWGDLNGWESEKLDGEEHAMFSFETTKEAMLKIQNISHGYHEACEGEQKTPETN